MGSNRRQQLIVLFTFSFIISDHANPPIPVPRLTNEAVQFLQMFGAQLPNMKSSIPSKTTLSKFSVVTSPQNVIYYSEVSDILQLICANLRTGSYTGSEQEAGGCEFLEFAAMTFLSKLMEKLKLARLTTVTATVNKLRVGYGNLKVMISDVCEKVAIVSRGKEVVFGGATASKETHEACNYLIDLALSLLSTLGGNIVPGEIMTITPQSSHGNPGGPTYMQVDYMIPTVCKYARNKLSGRFDSSTSTKACDYFADTANELLVGIRRTVFTNPLEHREQIIANMLVDKERAVKLHIRTVCDEFQDESRQFYDAKANEEMIWLCNYLIQTPHLLT